MTWQRESRFGVRISSENREIFPEAKLTKGNLADYYAKVSAIFLRDAANRPMSLVRCPSGIGEECFFQKHDTGGFGDHVHHVPIKEKDGTIADYLWLDDPRGVLACVQMGTIEFHGWGNQVTHLEAPDRLVFDLDPDVGLGWDEVRAAARLVRDRLAELGLQSFAMLTGGKGIHVIAPLDASNAWPAVSAFAKAFSGKTANAEPGLFTTNIRKKERTGRIFIDWLRNQRGATAVMPYSVRAHESAPVAAPIDWSELDSISGANVFTVKDVDELLQRSGLRALTGWGEARQAVPNY